MHAEIAKFYVYATVAMKASETFEEPYIHPNHLVRCAVGQAYVSVADHPGLGVYKRRACESWRGTFDVTNGHGTDRRNEDD